MLSKKTFFNKERFNYSSYYECSYSSLVIAHVNMFAKEPLNNLIPSILIQDQKYFVLAIQNKIVTENIEEKKTKNFIDS